MKFEVKACGFKSFFYIVHVLRLHQVVSKQDLCSSIKHSRMSKGNVYCIPQILFSCSSRNHDIHDRLKYPSKVDFLEFCGYFNIEEFPGWLVEVERFFEYRNTTKGKYVEFVARKLKGSAWLGKGTIQNGKR